MRNIDQQWVPGSWVCEDGQLLYDRECLNDIGVAEAVDETDEIINRLMQNAKTV